MRLTWKDMVTTVFMAGIVAVYTAFLQGAGWPLLGSVRGTTAVIMVLGVVGGCSFGAAGDLYGKHLRPSARAYLAFTSILGLAALGGGAYALITANEVALAVLFVATSALWLSATVHHLFTVPPTPVGLSRDTHETIEPHTVTPK